jgi:hypothetical protein
VTAARELTGAQIEALGDFEGIGFSGKMLRIVAQVCCRIQTGRREVKITITYQLTTDIDIEAPTGVGSR